MEITLVTIADASDQLAIREALRQGFRFSLEFGEPEADPMPGVLYMTRTIEEARAWFRHYITTEGATLARIAEYERPEIGAERQLFAGGVPEMRRGPEPVIIHVIGARFAASFLPY